MRTQPFSQTGASSLEFTVPMRIERVAGEFAVLSGRVWLTRQSDLHDYVIEAGERFVLEPSDAVLIEPWAAGEATAIEWKARCQRAGGLEALPRGAAAFALFSLASVATAVAFGFRRAEVGLEALARSAAAMARRAQGCIKAGDSIASAGTVQ